MDWICRRGCDDWRFDQLGYFLPPSSADHQIAEMMAL